MPSLPQLPPLSHQLPFIFFVQMVFLLILSASFFIYAWITRKRKDPWCTIKILYGLSTLVVAIAYAYVAFTKTSLTLEIQVMVWWPLEATMAATMIGSFSKTLYRYNDPRADVLYELLFKREAEIKE